MAFAVEKWSLWVAAAYGVSAAIVLTFIFNIVVAPFKLDEDRAREIEELNDEIASKNSKIKELSNQHEIALNDRFLEATSQHRIRLAESLALAKQNLTEVVGIDDAIDAEAKRAAAILQPLDDLFNERWSELLYLLSILSANSEKIHADIAAYNEVTGIIEEAVDNIIQILHGSSDISDLRTDISHIIETHELDGLTSMRIRED